jgi:hypothetical protein
MTNTPAWQAYFWRCAAAVGIGAMMTAMIVHMSEAQQRTINPPLSIHEQYHRQ